MRTNQAHSNMDQTYYFQLESTSHPGQGKDAEVTIDILETPWEVDGTQIRVWIEIDPISSEPEYEVKRSNTEDIEYQTITFNIYPINSFVGEGPNTNKAYTLPITPVLYNDPSVYVVDDPNRLLISKSHKKVAAPLKQKN